MNIVISGATGFIGSHLSAFLIRQGHQVTPLGRSLFKEESMPALKKAINGSDVVINLAGAPINRYWTPAYKKIIFESRVYTTRMIVNATNIVTTPPRLLISASATGIYPPEGCHDEYSTECGTGFLAGLCRHWESPLRTVPPSVRVAITRFGVVLSPDGGAFKPIQDLARLRTSAVIAPGTQPFSWIDLNDLIRAITFIMDTPSLDGVFNLVSPEETTNAQFAQEVTKRYHTVFNTKVPQCLLRLRYGEGASFLTQGQCACPTRLVEEGFSFTTETIAQFLRKYT